MSYFNKNRNFTKNKSKTKKQNFKFEQKFEIRKNRKNPAKLAWTEEQKNGKEKLTQR
jgi:hypothetical protein